MVENIQRLRESVLEAITGIIQGVKSNRGMLEQGMMQYAEQIMQFLKGARVARYILIGIVTVSVSPPLRHARLVD